VFHGKHGPPWRIADAPGRAVLAGARQLAGGQRRCRRWRLRVHVPIEGECPPGARDDALRSAVIPRRAVPFRGPHGPPHLSAGLREVAVSLSGG